MRPAGVLSTATVLAAIAVGLAACGPQYETFTNYAPPENEAGRQCLMQCQSARQLCRQTANLQVQQCRLGAQQEAQTENLRLAAEYQINLQRFQAGRRDHEPDPPSTVSPNYWPCTSQAASLEKQCTQDHDLCYQNCGGTVTYRTECVANCE